MFPICCAGNSLGTKGDKNGSPVARDGALHSLARAILPTGGLMLLPKCPACLAAYVAIVSGVGISATAARYLQDLLLTMCIASVTYFATKAASGLVQVNFWKRRCANAIAHPVPLPDREIKSMCDADS